MENEASGRINMEDLSVVGDCDSGTCGEAHGKLTTETKTACDNIDKVDQRVNTRLKASTFWQVMALLSIVVLASGATFGAMVNAQVSNVKESVSDRLARMEKQNETMIAGQISMIEAVGALRYEVQGLNTGLAMEIKRSEKADAECMNHVRHNHASP